MANYTHELPNDIQEEWHSQGFKGWRPSIAMPFFVGFGLHKAKCGCGRVFKNTDDFYAHYLYMAVWKGESAVQPTQWTDLSKAGS